MTVRQITKATLLATTLALALAACGAATPMWAPGTPRNGALQPVDPVYGTPIPGYPTINNN